MISTHSHPVRPMPAAGFIASVLGIGQGIPQSTVSITNNPRSGCSNGWGPAADQINVMINPKPIESAMDALRPGWRERRAKRKSPWNFVCAMLGLSATYYYMKAFGEAAVWLNLRIHPQNAVLAGNFYAYLDRTSSPSAMLMGLPLFVPALICGLITGNIIAWLIPPARRAMNNEAAGDREISFSGANAGLIKFGGFTSAICFILSAIGIFIFRA